MNVMTVMNAVKLTIVVTTVKTVVMVVML